MAKQQVITVEIWSDFVCPWCWIAKRRFEKALEKFEQKSLVDVNYKAFRIAAESSPAPFELALAEKLSSIDRANQMMSTVKAHGASENLIYNFETMQLGDTVQAHALIKAIIDPIRRNELLERLYLDSTTYGKSIFTKESLKSIALEIGISEIVVDDAWGNQRLKLEVIRDEFNSSKFGNGVPLFVFNSKKVVSGAQPTAVFLDALQSAIEVDVREDEVEVGQMCGLKGCN